MVVELEEAAARTAAWAARWARSPAGAEHARARAGARVSVDETRDDVREPVSWSVGGFLAAAALAVGVIALVWYPGRIGPGAMLIALVAAAMGGPHRRLAATAVAATTVCWIVGMVIAVLYEQPIF